MLTQAGDRLVGDKAQDYVVGPRLPQGQRAQDQAAPGRPRRRGAGVARHDHRHQGGRGRRQHAGQRALRLRPRERGDPLLVEEAAGTELPETVTVTAVTVAVGETAKIEPTVTSRTPPASPVRRGRVGPQGLPGGCRGQRPRPGGRRDGGRGEVLRQAHRERRREGDRHWVVGDTHRNMSREAGGGSAASPAFPFTARKEQETTHGDQHQVALRAAGHRHRHRARDRPRRRRGGRDPDQPRPPGQVRTAAQNKMGAIEALMSRGRETGSIAKIAGGQRQDRRRPPRRADRGHRRGLLRGAAARRGQRPRGRRRRLHAHDGAGVPRGAGDRQGPQRPDGREGCALPPGGEPCAYRA
ncbi:MAG: hypothetical protein ACLTDR_11730 [Adlercreutzia equolifaciens]